MPTTKPPAADKVVKMKWRRLKVAAVAVPCIATTSGLHHVRGAMNGTAQRFIRTAAADIGNTRVDVGVGRLGKGLQECGHGHDLPGLAVAALWNALFDPRALYRMVVVRGEALDGDHLRAIESTDRHRTGPHGGAVDMHRASAALGDTATEFCARQTDDVAQHPEQRCIGLYVDLPGCAVDINRNHFGSPSALRNRRMRSAGVYCERAGIAVRVEPTARAAADINVRRGARAVMPRSFPLLGSAMVRNGTMAERS